MNLQNSKFGIDIVVNLKEEIQTFYKLNHFKEKKQIEISDLINFAKKF